MADLSQNPSRIAANIRFDDPSLVIAAAMTAGDRLTASKEQLVFAWLLSLAPDQDPAVAAGSLLQRYEAAGKGQSLRGLLGLLAEVAAYPRERLTRLKSRRNRRR